LTKIVFLVKPPVFSTWEEIHFVEESDPKNWKLDNACKKANPHLKKYATPFIFP
jgi:hypothetical protein